MVTKPLHRLLNCFKIRGMCITGPLYLNVKLLKMNKIILFFQICLDKGNLNF